MPLWPPMRLAMTQFSAPRIRGQCSDQRTSLVIELAGLPVCPGRFETVCTLQLRRKRSDGWAGGRFRVPGSVRDCTLQLWGKRSKVTPAEVAAGAAIARGMKHSPVTALCSLGDTGRFLILRLVFKFGVYCRKLWPVALGWSLSFIWYIVCAWLLH